MSDRDGKKGGWLKWLLLLLAIALIVLIVLLLTGGDDDKTTTSSAGAAAATPAATVAAPEADAQAADAGTLVSGGTSLLAASQQLGSFSGESATGTGLKVLATAPAGFFVGTSDADAIYVEYGPKVGVDEPGSYKAQVGDTVDFEGPVKPVPDNAEEGLQITAAQAEMLRSRGGYINADTVKQTKDTP